MKRTSFFKEIQSDFRVNVWINQFKCWSLVLKFLAASKSQLQRIIFHVLLSRIATSAGFCLHVTYHLRSSPQINYIHFV